MVSVLRQSALWLGAEQQRQEACVYKMADGHFLDFRGSVPTRLGNGRNGLISVVEVRASDTIRMRGFVFSNLFALAERQIKQAGKGVFAIHC